MTTLALLTELRRQGVKFIIDGGKLRVMTPRGQKLSDTLKNEIFQRKGEILQRLCSGGITNEEVAAILPGANAIETDIDVGTCAHCAGWQWWISQHGIKICGSCFPPSSETLVVEWISFAKNRKNAA